MNYRTTEQNIAPQAPKWVKGNNGYIAGVCDGIAKGHGLDPGILRAAFVLGLFLSFGMALIVYLILAFCLPKENYIDEARAPRFLGVCYGLSRKFDLEVGLVRSLAVLLAMASFGLTVVVYFALYFVVADKASATH